MTFTIDEVRSNLRERAYGDRLLRIQDTLDWEKISEYDEGSYLLLREILSQYGPVTLSMFGEKASEDAWLLVQHQVNHPELMHEYLDYMLQDPENFRAENIAYLIDRCLWLKKKPQVYGTQFMADPETKKIRLYKTIDPKNLNSRRYAVGMVSIEEYLYEDGYVIDLNDMYDH
jgi:hypothetical protein